MTSLLDFDDDTWRTVAVGPSGARPTTTALTFVLDTCYHLEVLLAGGIWEREYDRDVWDLRRFARAPENTARYLRFDTIPQQWIRVLAKRWAHRMISANTASVTIAAKVRYLAGFAQFAAHRPDGCRRPEQLTRDLLEAWFAWMHAEGVHVATQKHKISAISVFLDTVHNLGWEERLPRTTVVVTGDALLALRTSGQSVTIARLAKDTGVSRSWLYTQPDLMAAVRQLAGQARALRSTPATGRSLQVRLATTLARNQRLQHRVDALAEQNKQQRQQLERAYAEIRRLLTTPSGSPDSAE